MGEIRVRPMRPDDIGAAAGITRAITGRKVPPGWNEMVTRLLRSHPGECLVAIHRGQVIGFILGELKEYAFGTERSGWIEVLGVHPRHMGKGVGNLLGRQLLSIFRQKGARAVFTAVKWDSGDLLAFFRSIGFDRSALTILEEGFARK